MRILRAGVLACIAALPMAATTIDVSSQIWQTLNTGDSLRFTISARNFASAAETYRVSADPTKLSFEFEAAAGVDGVFQAMLQSSDGRTSVALDGSLVFKDSILADSVYTGAVRTLGASFSFSEAVSARLFEGSGAILILKNAGPTVTVGLEKHKLRQDLSATLGGGPLQVGAAQGQVKLERAPQLATVLRGVLDEGPSVPEPSTALLMGVGTLLLLLSRRLHREFRRRIQ